MRIEHRMIINDVERRVLEYTPDGEYVFSNSLQIEDVDGLYKKIVTYSFEGIYKQENGTYWLVINDSNVVVVPCSTVHSGDVESLQQENISLREQSEVLEDELFSTQVALCDVYEENAVLSEKADKLEDELFSTQLALCDVYEMLAGV